MKRLALLAFACSWLVACEKPPSAPKLQLDATGAVVPPGGWTSSSGVGTAAVPDPLTPFKSLTLSTVGGDIDAVVYDGNIELQDATATTTLTGFTTPTTPPYLANTTYIVVDGQCGPGAPNGCFGRPTGGSGDGATFKGAGSLVTFTDPPDAFKGSDGCPWGPDTCLWDTRTFNVTPYVAPGDASATVTVTAGFNPVDGSDCINHEAQVFAVGPALAWGFGGYVASGRGLRNQGSGVLAVAGIPPTATVVEADLYWNILNSSTPAGDMTFNGNPITGTMYQHGGDPCWDGGSWAFRADVTTFVTGNGAYTVSGYPTGSTSGLNPWDFGSPTPMMEGATLIVFFGQASTPGKVTLGGYIDPVTGEIIDGSTLDIQQGPSAGNKATFGGVVQFQAGAASPTGNFRYIDHGPVAEDIKATSFSLLVISDGVCGPNTHAAFRFTGTENGTPGQEFKVEVDDCGEPGSNTPTGPDMFSIQKLPAGYMAAGPLVGGNVQVHK
jgi:hypothetical protein